MFSDNISFITSIEIALPKNSYLTVRCLFSYSYTLLPKLKIIHLFPIFVRPDSLNIALSFWYFLLHVKAGLKVKQEPRFQRRY